MELVAEEGTVLYVLWVSDEPIVQVFLAVHVPFRADAGANEMMSEPPYRKVACRRIPGTSRYVVPGWAEAAVREMGRGA